MRSFSWKIWHVICKCRRNFKLRVLKNMMLKSSPLGCETEAQILYLGRDSSTYILFFLLMVKVAVRA